MENPATDPSAALKAWLDSVPATDLNSDHTLNVKIPMSLFSWLIYARGAKHRGVSIGELFGLLLEEGDCRFEDRQFRTEKEWEAGLPARMAESTTTSFFPLVAMV